MTDKPGSIHSKVAPEPLGAYPHARRVGNLQILSDVGPRSRGNGEIPGVTFDQRGNDLEYDIELQCHAVFKNVRAVREEAGSSWDKLVDVTVFLTNI